MIKAQRYDSKSGEEDHENEIDGYYKNGQLMPVRFQKLIARTNLRPNENHNLDLKPIFKIDYKYKEVKLKTNQLYDYYRERTSQQHHHQFFNPNIIGQFKNMPIEKLIPACQLFYEKKLIEGNGLGKLEWRQGTLDADLLLKYIEIICKSTFEQRYLTLF